MLPAFAAVFLVPQTRGAGSCLSSSLRFEILAKSASVETTSWEIGNGRSRELQLAIKRHGRARRISGGQRARGYSVWIKT